ncbi:hypothetical protein V6N13_027975 [Hibiscus sabdariffa]
MRVEALWCSLTTGWCKLNTYSFRCNITGRASCGGVLRNEKDDWIMSFSCFIGVCSTFEAELWGILEGLNHAWHLDYRKFEVELDSLFTVRILHEKVSVEAHYNLLSHIFEALRRGWEVRLSHIFREANAIADELAKMETSVEGCIFCSLPAADRIDLKGTIFLSSLAAKWQYRSDNHMLQQGLILELGVSDDF